MYLISNVESNYKHKEEVIWIKLVSWYQPYVTDSGGEWITAYRVEQKKRFKTILSSASPEASSNSSRIFRPPTNTREASGSIVSRRYTLNKSFLLSHCYVDEPSDLCVANISGVGLEYVSY